MKLVKVYQFRCYRCNALTHFIDASFHMTPLIRDRRLYIVKTCARCKRDITLYADEIHMVSHRIESRGDFNGD